MIHNIVERSALNFSYVIPSVLAGMAKPGRVNTVGEDLLFIQKQGIKALVSLTESRLSEESLKPFQFEYLHLPVVDFSPPSLEQIIKCVSFIDAMKQRGYPSAVHCYAGIGRTGTILACYLVKSGYGADQAVERIRQLRPFSVQTRSQEKSVLSYERYLYSKT